MAWSTPWTGMWTACGLGVLSFLSVAPAAADEIRGPVVVELYTSQGCSACPPAEEMLRALSERSDVIALAMHVDYWDYIGWKDVFARPEHAERQRGYAVRHGKNMVYTPQMVIDGTAQVVGNKPIQVTEMVMKHAEAPDPVVVMLSREGDAVLIEASGAVEGAAEIHLVRFSTPEDVHITRGENKGQTLSYTNVVRDWARVATWDGRKPLKMRATLSGGDSVAVLVQEPDHGAILGAAALP